MAMKCAPKRGRLALATELLGLTACIDHLRKMSRLILTTPHRIAATGTTSHGSGAVCSSSPVAGLSLATLARLMPKRIFPLLTSVTDKDSI
jgi:hypothetical protein